jgi:hypothetical protein
VKAGHSPGQCPGATVILSGLETSTECTTAIFSDDTAVLAMDNDPAIASQELQTNLDAIRKWLKK